MLDILNVEIEIIPCIDEIGEICATCKWSTGVAG